MVGDCGVKLGLSEIGDVGKIGALEIGSLKDGVFHIGHPEIRVAKIRAPKVGFHEISDAQPGAFKIGILEIRTVEVRLLQSSIAQAQAPALPALSRDPLLMHRKHFF